MNHRITVRDELEKEIAAQGHSLSHFSNISGINRGILSATLNGNPPKPISIKQLDQMTHALGKEEGWLYEQFMNECFEDGKANWRRVRSLLVRCVELGNQLLIAQTLHLLMEDISYLTNIFEFAEDLTQEGKTLSALPFYQCIIEHERQSYSERMAISHYRIFRQSINKDIENNLLLAIQFSPYRDKLPLALTIDALLQLIIICYGTQDWILGEQYADELIYLIQITIEQQKKKNTFNSLDTPFTLVYYYAHSYSMKFVAKEYTAKYDEALLCIDKFADLSWFPGLDEAGLHEVERFKLFAIFNRHNIELLQGDFSRLDQYIELTEQHPKEMLASLHMALKAANMHNYDVDLVINKFSDIIYPDDLIQYINEHTEYTEQTGVSRYINLYYQLALYQCNKGTYDDKLEKILLALESTVTKYNKSRILDCLELFKKLRLISKNGN